MKNGTILLEDKDIKNFLEESVGEEGIKIIQKLGKKEHTDEQLAEHLDIRVNVVRRILYKLYEYRLASYTRTRDKEIGWYTYTWRLDLSRVSEVVKNRKEKVLDDLTRKLEYEKDNIFFECKNDRLRIPYGIATERNFRCPQCEGELMQKDNGDTVKALEKEIRRLEREVTLLAEGKAVSAIKAR